MSVDKLQGLRSKYNTVDEWLSGDVKEDVVGAIEQGASKNADYFILATSSEGTSRDGVGDSIKMELLEILKGEYDAPNVSIWHYKLDDISEINDPEMWVKANPNLGVTASYSAYQKDVDKAAHVPAARSDILAKRFGIPVEGLTYFFLYEETIPHRRQNFDGLPCAMGVDASQGDDFYAFTFMFPLGNGLFGVKARSYVHESKLKMLPKALQQKYQEFVDEGSLVILSGAVFDTEELLEDLDEFIEKHDYLVECVGYDPYGAHEFINHWTLSHGDYGLTKVRQGARTESVPLGELKSMARERLLIFDEEIMKFTMGNSVALQDNNGNYKLSKKRSDEKIDNVAALMDAWVAYKKFQEAF